VLLIEHFDAVEHTIPTSLHPCVRGRAAMRRARRQTLDAARTRLLPLRRNGCSHVWESGIIHDATCEEEWHPGRSGVFLSATPSRQ
jgi:hypothetical protein